MITNFWAFDYWFSCANSFPSFCHGGFIQNWYSKQIWVAIDCSRHTRVPFEEIRVLCVCGLEPMNGLVVTRIGIEWWRFRSLNGTVCLCLRFRFLRIVWFYFSMCHNCLWNHINDSLQDLWMVQRRERTNETRPSTPCLNDKFLITRQCKWYQ